MSGRQEGWLGRRAPSESSIVVVVVDRPSVVSQGLTMVLAAEPDMEVATEVASSDEALTLLGRIRGAGQVVVIVGLGLAGEHDALWLIRSIRERYPTVRVVCSGTRAEAASVSRALLVGADGYVDKEAITDRFIGAIRRCIAGDVVLEGLPENALGAIAHAMESQAGAGRVVTERERSVLALAAQGLTARQIANRLGLSDRTVTTHLDHIYRKLGVSGRVAAISEGARLGLVAVGTA
jgi:DNA-binding NarL/FixJ family response regulator